jgi:hypothetical protein
MQERLLDPSRTAAHVLHALNAAGPAQRVFEHPAADPAAASAVLLLLSACRSGSAPGRESCLVLNKRSLRVRQPGDLCCPGGSVSPRVDGWAARILAWPFLPLGRWPFWGRLRRERPRQAHWLALCLATALRESFEEMRLNPLRVQFLGPLPPQRLELFRRLIYPLAAWAPGPGRYRPNWEVQRVVTIPLRRLLDPGAYVRCDLQPESPYAGSAPRRIPPAFRLDAGGGTEILWGATYRIVVGFLQAVFDFTPPAPESLPLVGLRLGEGYLAGRAAPASAAGRSG